LGLKYSDPNFEEEAKYLTVKHQGNQDQIEFLVSYQGQETLLSPVQVTATMISKLKQLIQREGFENVSDIVLSVPSFYSEYVKL